MKKENAVNEQTEQSGTSGTINIAEIIDREMNKIRLSIIESLRLKATLYHVNSESSFWPIKWYWKRKYDKLQRQI